MIDRVGSTEIASCIDVTYQEKQLSKVVLSNTVQRLPTVLLEVEYTPAVEFVRVRHVVTRFLSRQLLRKCLSYERPLDKIPDVPGVSCDL